MKMIFGVGIALLINSVIVTAICPDPGPNCNCSSLGAEWIAVTDKCSEGGCMMKFDGPNTTFEEALNACKEKIALGSHLMTWHSISCFDDLEQWLICENNADPDHTVQWWTAGGEEIPNAVKKGQNGKKWIDIVFDDDTVENVIVKIESSVNGQVLKYSTRPPSAKYGYICQAYCDNCGSGPCQNDGNCTNNGTEYTCSCLPGYTGTNCETGMDPGPCFTQACQNTNICTDPIENDNGGCDCGGGVMADFECEPALQITTISSNTLRWDEFATSYPIVKRFVVIENEEGKHYNLTSDIFSVECDFDFVKVYDNSDVNAPYPWPLTWPVDDYDNCLNITVYNCGYYTTLPLSIVVDRSSIILQFTSEDDCTGQVAINIIAFDP